MAKTEVTVRNISSKDRDRWMSLWAEYLNFYNESLAADITDATWNRFFDEDCPLYCLVVENQVGEVLGFAAHVVHPGTWGAGNVCYLEDLYVAPDARGMGAARKMIEQLIARGKEQGWYRVYWHTDDGNHVARAFYDKIATLSDRIKYDVAL